MGDTNGEIERIRDDVYDDVDDAMKNRVLPSAVHEAQEKIRDYDRVWLNDLVNEFGFFGRSTRGQGGQLRYVIKNYSDYAEPHDTGWTYSRPPPKEAVRPWTAAHMHYFTKIQEQVANRGGTHQEAIDRAAHAVSWGLYKRGLSGIHYMARAKWYVRQRGERRIEIEVNGL